MNCEEKGLECPGLSWDFIGLEAVPACLGPPSVWLTLATWSLLGYIVPVYFTADERGRVLNGSFLSLI